MEWGRRSGDDAPMARSIWTGSISFGLVNIPVRLMTAVRDQGVHLHMLSSDGRCRLRRKLVCPDTGEEYDFNNTARGFEIAPDQYVLIKDEEIDKIRPEAGRAIELVEFVKLEHIDPMYYERSYWLAPDQGGTKGYGLLLRAMEEQGRVAIGRFVMRQKQYVCALRPHNGALVLETMRYSDEVVGKDEAIDSNVKVEVNAGELKMAQQLIDALAVDEFDPAKYHDEYRDRLMELIEAKREGEEIVLHEGDDEDLPPVINLMEALQRSLAGAKKSGATAPAAKSHGRPTKKAPAPKRRKSA